MYPIKRLSVKIPIDEYYAFMKFLEMGVYLGNEYYEYKVQLDEYNTIIFRFIKEEINKPNINVKISIKENATGIKEKLVNFDISNEEALARTYQYEYNDILIYFKFDIETGRRIKDVYMFFVVIRNRFNSIRIISEVRNLLNCSNFTNEWELIEFAYIALNNINCLDVLSKDIIDKLEYYGIDEDDMVDNIDDVVHKFPFGYYEGEMFKTFNDEIINLLLAQIYNKSLTKIHKKEIIEENIKIKYKFHLNKIYQSKIY